MEPQQLGPYVLIKRLGRGGMGAVYEAEHQDTGEHVAVKVLASHLADDLGLKERFDAVGIDMAYPYRNIILKTEKGHPLDVQMNAKENQD